MKWLLGFMLLMSSLAYAQHNNRSGRDLQFRFGNPGARSLAFGGAFIGLADDATAPVANPAGATRTTKRSMAFELNYNQIDNNIPFAAGHIQQVNLFEFDYQFSDRKAEESFFQIPYLAVVVPKDKWRLGFFLHQQANFSRAYENEEVTYCLIASNGYPDCLGLGAESFPASTELLELKILNGGVSVAREVTDKISLGLSVFYSQMDYQADSNLYAPQASYDATVYRFARGDDSSLGLIAGGLWQATRELSLGVTYKRQPKFDYTASLESSRPVPNTPEDFSSPAIFKIPDSLGFGINISPMDQLSINIDANRVYYSQITDELVDFAQLEVNNSTLLQTMADITEIHMGLEWVYLGLANPLSLRVGYWLDPYHAPVNNVEDSQILYGPRTDPTVRDVFFLHLFEQNENHYSLGFGYTFGQKFQLDMAVQAADSSRDATISGIYRF